MAQKLNIYFIKILKEEKMLKRNKGFSLIELMIVVAIIAILAMIMTPNLLTAIQKAKLKSTIEDMRNIGMAVDNYMTDWGMAVSTGTIATLRTYLQPFYTKKFAEQDQWNHDFHYQANLDDYSVGSGGKDGSFSWPASGQLYNPPTSKGDFDRDLVYSDGSFTYAPRQH